MPKSTPKKNLTKYEKEKLTKKESYEQIEEVLTTGQENVRKGRKWTEEVTKETEATEAREISNRLELATKKRQFNDLGYLMSLREACIEYIDTIDYKEYPGWRLKLFITTGQPIAINKKAFSTKRGLLAILTSPEGNYFAKGITACFDPIIDVKAARLLGVVIEDSLDHYTGKTSTKKIETPKIWTPGSLN
jgi:hypothetical protein